MFAKKNFPVDTKVRFVKTGDSRLDGQTGTVLGKSFTHPVTDFYIVLLSIAITGYLDKAICMIEACLESVES